jgi:hypothetical protein
MKPILIAGTSIVIVALVSYSLGVITEQRKHRVTRFVLVALTFGALCDITATVCMILGSTNPWYTLHGLLGYSSLAAMLTDTVLLWRHRLVRGEAEVGAALHLYSRVAYIWWVLAFITGGLLVAVNRAG